MNKLKIILSELVSHQGLFLADVDMRRLNMYAFYKTILRERI